MDEDPEDELLITLRIKRHQLSYRDDGTLYGLHDNIGSLIHIGGGNTTQIVGIGRPAHTHGLVCRPEETLRCGLCGEMYLICKVCHADVYGHHAKCDGHA